MTETSTFDLYLKINEENYAVLIEQLLAETQERRFVSNRKLQEARREFFVVAISKGAELSGLPEKVAALTTDQAVLDAAKAIPDKEANGWKDITSLSEANRTAFAEAGKRRKPEMQWDNLFPEGSNEIVLPFTNQARSLKDRIEEFIYEHNQRAQEEFEKARQADKAKQQVDPDTKPAAGKTIEQRQIRLAFDGKGKAILETCNPNKTGEGAWETGPALGSYLQKKFQWSLFDHLQRRGLKSVTEATNTSASANVKDIADHSPQKADELFDSGNLRVVISRDPQKIGEMSTGQRWRSCMANDGIYYSHVSSDIEAGTLVAFVVHKDDEEARYPLMRQLLKPYRQVISGEDGKVSGYETILVPANIYGGEGADNSRTRDGLRQTLNNFVSKQNSNKSGLFLMAPGLYADGQSKYVSLDSRWSQENIQEAVRKYQDSVLQESIAELRINQERLQKGLKGEGDGPKSHIKKNSNKVHHSFAIENTEVGLPRMFYNEMHRTSIGSVPNPRDIVDAVAKDTVLMARTSAFNALKNQDQVAWAVNTEKLPFEVSLQTAVAASLLAQAASAHEEFIVKVIKDILASTETAEERVVLATEVFKKSVKGSALQECAGTIVVETVPQLSDIKERVSALEVMFKGALEHSTLHTLALEALVKDVQKLQELPTARERVEIANKLALFAFEGSPLQETAYRVVVDNMQNFPVKEQLRIAKHILSYVVDESPLREQVGALMLSLAEHITIDDRINAIEVVARSVPEDSAVEKRAHEMLLKNIQELPSAQERVKAADGTIVDTIRDAFKEDFYRVILDNIPKLPTVEERVQAADRVVWWTQEGTETKKLALSLFLQNVQELPTAEERIKIAMNMAYDAPRGSALSNGVFKIVLDNIPQLPDEKRDSIVRSLDLLIRPDSTFRGRIDEILQSVLPPSSLQEIRNVSPAHETIRAHR